MCAPSRIKSGSSLPREAATFEKRFLSRTADEATDRPTDWLVGWSSVLISPANWKREKNVLIQ